MKSLSTMVPLLVGFVVPFSVFAEEGKVEPEKKEGEAEKGKLYEYEEGREDIVGVSDEDEEMNAAMEKARKTLPEFVKEIQKRDDKNKLYMIKVLISEGEHGEHVWLVPVKWMDPGLVGILASEPAKIKKVKKGDVIRPLPSEISDWVIMNRDGTKQGGFTMDVIEKHEKAAKKEGK